MIDVNKYLSAHYVDCGRELPGIDCWGLVLLVRRELGFAELDQHLVSGKDAKGFTRAYRQQAEVCEVCEPEVGAVVAAFRGSLCLHVAVVVEIEGRLAVLEITETGARWMRLPAFESKYPKVVYYRDKRLP